MSRADEHEHGGHSHGAAGGDARWLSAALALILAFMAAEISIGLAAHSLALISDAAHMLTDAASIALVLITARLAARPPQGGYTYGLKRAEILSAQANGITLVLLAVWLCYFAIRRLLTPPEVAGGAVLGVALAGVAVNVVATLLIARAPGRQRLNVKGAFQHIVTDLYAFIATAVAGLIIIVTGFGRADAIATLVVVVLMLHAGYGLLRDSGRIFLEAAPAKLAPERWARRWRPGRSWPRCTTCTSGRSPPASPPRPRTCWSRPARTATPCAPTWRRSSSPRTESRTRPCRWITHRDRSRTGCPAAARCRPPATRITATTRTAPPTARPRTPGRYRRPPPRPSGHSHHHAGRLPMIAALPCRFPGIKRSR